MPFLAIPRFRLHLRKDIFELTNSENSQASAVPDGLQRFEEKRVTFRVHSHYILEIMSNYTMSEMSTLHNRAPA